jgi:hypothetical protein
MLMQSNPPIVSEAVQNRAVTRNITTSNYLNIALLADQVKKYNIDCVHSQQNLLMLGGFGNWVTSSWTQQYKR